MIYMFMEGIRPPYKVCSYVLAFIQDYSPQLYYKSVTEELIGGKELKICLSLLVPAFIWATNKGENRGAFRRFAKVVRLELYSNQTDMSSNEVKLWQQIHVMVDCVAKLEYPNNIEPRWFTKNVFIID